MLSRYLDIFVLSDAHYYGETLLLKALHHNRAVRRVFTSRYSIEEYDIRNVNTIFLDPSVYSVDPGVYSFDRVPKLIECIRNKYPHVVFVLCSTGDTIRHFIAATGNRFAHYFQLDYAKVASVPDPLVDEVVKACQVEVDRNCRSAHKYDVVLSFAGEQREYAQAIAHKLKANGVAVFYK